TALLTCQRCQGNSFCNQYQIVEFQAAHHGRWALTTTGVSLVCQRVDSVEGCTQCGSAPHDPDVVPHLLPQGATYRFISVWCVVNLRRAMLKGAEVRMGAWSQVRRW